MSCGTAASSCMSRRRFQRRCEHALHAAQHVILRVDAESCAHGDDCTRSVTEIERCARQKPLNGEVVGPAVSTEKCELLAVRESMLHDRESACFRDESFA